MMGLKKSLIVLGMIFFAGMSCAMENKIQEEKVLSNKKIYTTEEKELIISLYDIGVLKFNTDTMKLPWATPYYVDMRGIISYPKILKKVTLLLAQKAKDLSFDCICGVPYAALAMSTTLAYELERPLIMRRSSIKKYGTGKKIEGVFKKNDRCLVIEDVVTTATGIKETINDLEEHNLKVLDCIILFDRQQGGIQWMENKGYKFHVLFTISDFMQVLSQEGKITTELADSILSWTKEHQVPGVSWRTE